VCFDTLFVLTKREHKVYFSSMTTTAIKEELQAFLKPLEIRKRISKETEMSLRYLYLISRGERWIPIRHAPAFEVASGGRFSRKKLFPEQWRKWWPELAERDADRGTA
jgi:hypothetical protein